MTHEINDQDSVSRLTIKAWTQMHWSKQGFDKVFMYKKKSLNTKLLLYGGKKQNKTH